MTPARERFALDVLEGLSVRRKALPARCLYDDEGSALFSRIMDLPEYYPTRCEVEILRRRAPELARELAGEEFSVVELGAGDGRKTQVLLEAFCAAGLRPTYVPVDVSRAALEASARAARERFHLRCEGLLCDYFEAFHWLRRAKGGRRLVLFLGSSVGNLTQSETLALLRALWAALSPEDRVLIGFDLKKDIAVLERAYDDAQGVTRRFNLNLLERINRELGGRFEPERFRHHSAYNAAAGAMESFLVSREEQTVRVEALERSFTFHAFEAVHVETSRKYLVEETQSLARRGGFRSVAQWLDARGYFLDALWAPKTSATA